jgi:single-stranded DNA-binding protein
MEGKNFVILQGSLRYPKPAVTQNGFPKFTAKMAVPVKFTRNGQEQSSEVYFNVIAWGDVAEGMGELIENTPLEIQGHLNTRSYDGKCRHCGGADKKYWSEVQIDNFKIVLG